MKTHTKNKKHARANAQPVGAPDGSTLHAHGGGGAANKRGGRGLPHKTVQLPQKAGDLQLAQLFAVARSRGFYLLLAAFAAGLAALSYWGFERYLHILPCAEVARLRFGLCVLAAAGLAGAAARGDSARAFAYALGFYALFVCIKASLELEISQAIAEKQFLANPAAAKAVVGGAVGVGAVAPFGLNLGAFGEFFAAKTACAAAVPAPPEGAQLSDFQRYLIGSPWLHFADGIYSRGWFLLPAQRLGTLGLCAWSCCVAAGCVCAIVFAGFAAFRRQQAAAAVAGACALYFCSNALEISALAG